MPPHNLGVRRQSTIVRSLEETGTEIEPRHTETVLDMRALGTLNSRNS